MIPCLIVSPDKLYCCTIAFLSMLLLLSLGFSSVGITVCIQERPKYFSTACNPPLLRVRLSPLQTQTRPPKRLRCLREQSVVNPGGTRQLRAGPHEQPGFQIRTRKKSDKKIAAVKKPREKLHVCTSELYSHSTARNKAPQQAGDAPGEARMLTTR